jgi:Type II secretion system (T2SS), protein M subtype b
MKTGTFTALDLRLMFSRQPGLMILLGALVVLILVILARPSQVGQVTTAPAIDPARIVAAQRNFRRLLIPSADLAAAQQAVLDVAASHHLRIGRVDYTQEADTEGRFVRASMRLPINGRYADIRAFLEGSLAGQPAMSIRHLSIQRETATEPNSVLTATLTAQFLVGEALR